MRVLVAPLELKGTLTAGEAAEAIAEGLVAADPGLEVELLPLADGGPGTLEAIERSRRASLVKTTQVTGADGSQVAARWLVHGELAIIESAEAVGITRFPGRAALDYTSRGVGELVAAAIAGGARDIAIGIGGTATVDLGLGCAAALGARCIGADGHEVVPRPRDFARIHDVVSDAVASHVGRARLSTWCDVQAPLLGQHGFVYRYGGQKGVGIADMPELEREASRLTRSAAHGVASDGAGGGLAWGLRVLCGAKPRSGFDAVAETVGLADALERCSFVITAEGRLDAQSTQGKGPWALAQRARLAGRPVILMTGSSQLAPDVWRTAFTDVVTVGTREPENKGDAYRQLVTTARAYSLHGPLLARPSS
ncbi:MAG: glycerate kinase [Myxococcota bacterium]|nr:glycerate kinase [Myxococcota bacterium]